MNAVVETAVLAATAVGLFVVLGIAQPTGAVMLTGAASTALAASLLTPGVASRPVGHTGRLAVTAALVTVVILLWQTGLARPGPVLSLGVAVGALTLFLGGVARVALRWSETLAHWLPTTVLVVAATVPFWATSVAHRTGADALVGVSPLSYLATIADFDYLRTTPGYRHSTISGLRYDYPNPGVYTLFLIAAAAGLVAGTRNRPPRHTVNHSRGGEPEQCP